MARNIHTTAAVRVNGEAPKTFTRTSMNRTYTHAVLVRVEHSGMHYKPGVVVYVETWCGSLALALKAEAAVRSRLTKYYAQPHVDGTLMAVWMQPVDMVRK